MLSIKECEKILNEKENKYSKEKISLLRELLYQLGQLDQESFLKQQDEQRSVATNNSRFIRESLD